MRSWVLILDSLKNGQEICTGHCRRPLPNCIFLVALDDPTCPQIQRIVLFLIFEWYEIMILTFISYFVGIMCIHWLSSICGIDTHGPKPLPTTGVVVLFCSEFNLNDCLWYSYNGLIHVSMLWWNIKAILDELLLCKAIQFALMSLVTKCRMIWYQPYPIKLDVYSEWL